MLAPIGILLPLLLLSVAESLDVGTYCAVKPIFGVPPLQVSACIVFEYKGPHCARLQYNAGSLNIDMHFDGVTVDNGQIILQSHDHHYSFPRVALKFDLRVGIDNPDAIFLIPFGQDGFYTLTKDGCLPLKGAKADCSVHHKPRALAERPPLGLYAGQSGVGGAEVFVDFKYPLRGGIYSLNDEKHSIYYYSGIAYPKLGKYYFGGVRELTFEITGGHLLRCIDTLLGHF
ncbi:hypothetical protein FOZ60_001191 [Perkinsus olseni]|uniref:Uncharacterized protein n=1 Tax=Perkinsus olseni TaxID=32597 RepID=A0A7J6P0U6_PEROL|nr:hypothetical protein FOZ60_001191 [Perkinsus olseni]